MPDISRKTISATEMAGLLGVSPWVTPWMIYQKFANGLDIDSDGDSRMLWGQLLEPVVLAQTSRALGLEIQPNRDAQGIQAYVSRGLLGCTRDATIWSPNDGPGACETKCVFDYSVWMDKWEAGKRVPTGYEIQLQMQMYVGDGETPYGWGIIPVFICGDLKLDFRRTPNLELWALFEKTATEFFANVAANKIPDPFGHAAEIPLLRQLYPPVKKKVLDYTGHEDAYKVAEDVRMMIYYGEQKTGNDNAEKEIKNRLAGIMLDNEELLLPHGIIARRKPHGNGIRVTAYIPPNIPEGDISFFGDANLAP